jgi:hypothetical protein
LTSSGQGEVGVGRLLRLLDEAMKRHDPLASNYEQHTRDLTAGKIAAHFPQAVSERAAQRHTDWPTILDAHQILADGVSVSVTQSAQPVPQDFTACGSPIEDDGIFRGFSAIPLAYI